MDLIARVGERVERVSIEREGARFLVRIGERAYDVESRALGGWVRSLLVDGASYEVAVFRRGTDAWSISHRGRSTPVEVLAPLAHLAEATRGEGARKGRQVVAAYMPGRVVAVSVAEGDAVEAGAPLVVLEAMKMQNEIQAERAAVVRRIHVTPGQAVEGGDPLVELE